MESGYSCVCWVCKFNTCLGATEAKNTTVHPEMYVIFMKQHENAVQLDFQECPGEDCLALRHTGRLN